jgi:hypothetical protein
LEDSDVEPSPGAAADEYTTTVISASGVETTRGGPDKIDRLRRFCRRVMPGRDRCTWITRGSIGDEAHIMEGGDAQIRRGSQIYYRSFYRYNLTTTAPCTVTSAVSAA